MYLFLTHFWKEVSKFFGEYIFYSREFVFMADNTERQTLLIGCGKISWGSWLYIELSLILLAGFDPWIYQLSWKYWTHHVQSFLYLVDLKTFVVTHPCLNNFIGSWSINFQRGLFNFRTRFEQWLFKMY